MKKFTLTVSEPCHENWNAMTPEEKGRFCASCQKMVVDFAAMSDRQIAEHFRKTSGSLCGRFHPHQLNREIVVPKKPLPWMKYYLTVTWPAFVLLLKSCGQKNDVMGEALFRPETSQTITGMQQATATSAIMGDTMLVKPVAVEKATCSMVKGDVEVAPASGRKRKLTPPVLNVCMEKKPAVELPGIETKTTGSASLTDPLNEGQTYILGGISIVKAKRFKRQLDVTSPVPKEKEKCAVTVFPNPVSRNQAISIKTDKALNGTYLLINLSGQVMTAGRLNIVAEQPFSIPVQSWAAGTYFINLIDERTGKSFSQKIMVQ